MNKEKSAVTNAAPQGDERVYPCTIEVEELSKIYISYFAGCPKPFEQSLVEKFGNTQFKRVVLNGYDYGNMDSIYPFFSGQEGIVELEINHKRLPSDDPVKDKKDDEYIANHTCKTCLKGDFDDLNTAWNHDHLSTADVHEKEGFDKLIQILSSSECLPRSLTSITFTDLPLNVDSTVLWFFFHRCGNLKKVSFVGFNTANWHNCILKALMDLPNLEDLRFYGGVFSEKSERALLSMLPQCKKLLNFSFCENRGGEDFYKCLPPVVDPGKPKIVVQTTLYYIESDLILHFMCNDAISAIVFRDKDDIKHIRNNDFFKRYDEFKNIVFEEKDGCLVMKRGKDYQYSDMDELKLEYDSDEKKGSDDRIENDSKRLKISKQLFFR